MFITAIWVHVYYVWHIPFISYGIRSSMLITSVREIGNGPSVRPWKLAIYLFIYYFKHDGLIQVKKKKLTSSQDVVKNFIEFSGIKILRFQFIIFNLQYFLCNTNLPFMARWDRIVNLIFEVNFWYFIDISLLKYQHEFTKVPTCLRERLLQNLRKKF